MGSVKNLDSERGEAVIASLSFYFAVIAVVGVLMALFSMVSTSTNGRDSSIELKAAATSVTDVVVLTINQSTDATSRMEQLSAYSETVWRDFTEVKIRDTFKAWVVSGTLSGDVLTLNIRLEKTGLNPFLKDAQIDIVPAGYWAALPDYLNNQYRFLEAVTDYVSLNVWTVGEVRLLNEVESNV